MDSYVCIVSIPVRTTYFRLHGRKKRKRKNYTEEFNFFKTRLSGTFRV